MEKATIRDVDLAGRHVLMRADFNVPLDAEGGITDDMRIRAALPTIRYILRAGASLVLMSHLGRPKGPNPKDSLRPVAARLSELLGQPVPLAPDAVGPAVTTLVAALQPGQVLLLENLRFHPEEEANEPAFAAELAKLGDIYVNDAFGTAHRAHASTEGVAHDLPAYAGFLMEKELNFLGGALEHPQRPLVAITGGAKVSDKIAVLERLITLADAILIGGGMANTFFKAAGIAVGDSLVEDGKLDEARRIQELALTRGVRFILPTDVVIADRFAADAQSRVMPLGAVPVGWRILDIGPATVALFAEALGDAQTIVFNGTLGVAEFPAFAEGTDAVIKLLTERAQAGATVIIGGGDSAAAVEAAGAADKVTHVSTGGGASLEFLEGKTLPGVAALRDRTEAH
ncbi:MAG: phosphoglycerate kinase [Ktedonobacterales bacterium]|nr:phosphoglycerate kinase [Ktedonobacterales bacterium]